ILLCREYFEREGSAFLITRLTLRQLADALDKKELSGLEITEAYLRRIEEEDPLLRVYITVTAEKAREQAAAADRRRGEGRPLSRLDGVPAALKDDICTRGVRTTCASEMLKNFVPPYSAGCYERLEQAGAVLLGKCAMNEFSVSPSFFPSGSVGEAVSDGAARAVANGLAPFALGSDMDGGLRIPVSAPGRRGVTGLKPTYGLVSRYGLIPVACSLEQVGALGASVEDCAVILSHIAGPDSRDSTAAPQPAPDFLEGLELGVRGLKIGLPKEYLQGPETDASVRALAEAAARDLAAAGAQIIEISLPHAAYARQTHYILAAAEASSNLARYDGINLGLRAGRATLQETVRQSRTAGFGAEVKSRVMFGNHVLSKDCYDDYYLKAMQARTLIKSDYDAAFGQVSCLLLPAASKPGGFHAVGANLAGLPALMVPCGETSGLQLIGPAFSEPLLLRAGRALEQARI
ncbi:MAG: aspartyl/glutamyl-tRNA amidotransferase subunit A, partial [Clostridiales bacterium]|nr:aspartyl/glutamyl-tRNA amidotransferase subunit A [Clostridiales bacterium]